jgi:DNA-directed RNA polymerase I, II, and III subunit RPABC1
MSSSESENSIQDSDEYSSEESDIEEHGIQIEDSVKQISRELLEARGYLVYKDFHNDSYPKIIGKNKEKKSLQILFIIDQKLNVEPLNKIIKHLIDTDVKHCIIVHAGNNVSAKILEISNNLLTLKIKLEFFPYNNLRYNITKHELVPKHELITGEEAINLRKKFGKVLTVMLTTDPVSRFYGFNRGDIIKIYRRDSTITYRIVY